MRQKIIIITLILSLIGSIYSFLYLSVKLPVKCGVIIEKRRAQVIQSFRYNTRIKPCEIIVVKYKDRIQTEITDTNTYYTNNIGDLCCFEQNKEHHVLASIAFTLFIVIFIITISIGLTGLIIP